jgi:histidine transport system ATP-binding protein
VLWRLNPQTQGFKQFPVFLFGRAGMASNDLQQAVGKAQRGIAQGAIALFDEPTSALDPELVGEVLKVMQQLAEEGRTMVVVTHEMAFARQVSNHVMFLHQGRVEEQGAPAIVLDKPESERLQQFLSGSLK